MWSMKTVFLLPMVLIIVVVEAIKLLMDKVKVNKQSVEMEKIKA
jgi:hypothetical protein